MNWFCMKNKVSMLLVTALLVTAVMLPLGSGGQQPDQASPAPKPAPAPTLMSFAPIHAVPGATVTITGDHLADATAVTFGVGGWDGKNPGVPAGWFHAVSNTEIVAEVPPRSYWGYIQVTTPGGTVDSSSVAPVNYFFPDNLQIASGAGGPMFPVGLEVPLEARHAIQPRRYGQRPAGSGGPQAPPPGVAVDHPGDVYPPANGNRAQAGGAQAPSAAYTPRETEQQGPPPNPAGPEPYRLFLNEYNSDAPFVIDSDNGADYRISVSEVDSTKNWVRRPNGVAAYPSIFAGKHWRVGTQDGTDGLPILLSAIRGGGVLTSSFTADLSQVSPGGKWDSAWDMFLSTVPDGGGNSYEIMVWLHRVDCQPIGGHVQATVTIDGQTFDVWQGGHTVSYVANPLKEGSDATLKIDVGKIMDDSIKRGFFPENWYLVDIEAGFEVWDGSNNLVAKHFDVTYNKDATAK
jgi:hypothetical protein